MDVTVDAVTDDDVARYSGWVSIRSASGGAFSVDSGRRVVRRRAWEGGALEVPATELASAIAAASEGLSDPVVEFEADLDSEVDYGYGGEACETSVVTGVAVWVRGLAELSDGERGDVRAEIARHRHRSRPVAEAPLPRPRGRIHRW